MAHSPAAGGLGFLLDSAVKTAVTHLATSQPNIQHQVSLWDFGNPDCISPNQEKRLDFLGTS